MKKNHENQSSSLEKLGELIHGIKYSMMTTMEKDGSLRSRPMYTQDREFDGDLWFFTGFDSAKVDEIVEVDQVNLSYVSENQKTFVSVSGRAQILHDKNKIREMWKPYYKAWFPGGVDDPNIALVRVSVDYAEYWDTPSGVLVRLEGLVKAMTGKGGDLSAPAENRKIDLGGHP